MDKPVRKVRYHLNEVKNRHISHWDLDLLDADQLEAMYVDGYRQRQRRRGRRYLSIAALAVLTLLATYLIA